MRNNACEKVSLIQSDIEGGGEDALEGAYETLKRDKPNIIFELNKSYYSFAMPLTMIPHVAKLGNLGYQLCAIRIFGEELHNRFHR